MLKFVPYLTRSILRNRGRSVLTVLGVGMAVFIVTGLGAILNSRTRALEAASETTVIVSEKDQY